MSRWWTEHVAGLGDGIGLGVLTLLLMVLAVLLGAGWYWYPKWLPWRWWPRRAGTARTRRKWHWSWAWLRWPRWRRKRRPARKPAVEQPAALADDELPDLPAAAFVSLADELAAQGRYAEAVRERLRGIVRELVDAQIIDNRPGWTVTELARAAGIARPAVHPPLSQASAVFSDIWYGERPATAAHDQRMREYAGQVHAALLSAALANALVGGPR